MVNQKTVKSYISLYYIGDINIPPTNTNTYTNASITGNEDQKDDD
jgi:hypothetical protein